MNYSGRAGPQVRESFSENTMPRDRGGRGRGRGTRSSANAERQRAGVCLRAGPPHQQLGWECAFASVRPLIIIATIDHVSTKHSSPGPCWSSSQQPSGRQVWPKGRRPVRVSRCSQPLYTRSCPFMAHGPRGGGSHFRHTVPGNKKQQHAPRLPEPRCQPPGLHANC